MRGFIGETRLQIRQGEGDKILKRFAELPDKHSFWKRWG
jgi:hypothetical protein